MTNSSMLSSESIQIRRAPGRTDALIDRLRGYLEALFSPDSGIGSAELTLRGGDVDARLEWTAGEPSALDARLLDALFAADEIDIRMSLCHDAFRLADRQREIGAMLADGSLKDCVRYRALLEDGQTASLVLSGLYRGAFLHGAVPFTTDHEDILAGTRWGGGTHRAEFRFGPDADVDALAEELEQSWDVELSQSGGALRIEGVRLEGHEDVRRYREALERLANRAERALITGALSPEDDDVFALLRFVRSGRSVIREIAVAER